MKKLAKSPGEKCREYCEKSGIEGISLGDVKVLLKTRKITRKIGYEA
jgi:hypothetical protein